MLDILEREFIYLWYYFDIQLRQIFWYWVLGMALGSAVSVFLKDHIHDTVRSLGQKKLGVLGIGISSILGIASPLCMYGTIPIAASFSRSGVRYNSLVATVVVGRNECGQRCFIHVDWACNEDYQSWCLKDRFRC